MTNPEQRKEFMKQVNERLKQAGFQVFDEKTPSLSYIIKKETSEIVQKDPLFFQRYNIPTPSNPEEQIFDLYFKDGGSAGVNYVINAAKHRYQMLSYYLDSKDPSHQGKLQFAIQEIKDIFKGPIGNKE